MVTASVAATAGFHPAIVPSIVEKRNKAGLAGASKKSVWLLLAMVPVGVPSGVFLLFGSACGMVTTRDRLTPAPSYSVLKPVLWSETHHALPEPRDIPQGLINGGSVTGATPASLETRLVWV